MEAASAELPEPDDTEEEEREPTFLEWFTALADVDDQARESLTKEVYPDPQLMAVAMDMPAPRASLPAKPKG